MKAWHAWVLVAVGLALALGLERAAFASAEVRANLLLAAGIYAVSHGLRVLRILFLLGDASGSLRRVGLAHLATAPVAALVPLKLGDLARIGAFAAESRGLVHALGAVWVERTFDAVVLATAAALTALFFPELAATATTVAVLATVFLGVTAVAIFVLPENIDEAKHFLIVRYTSEASLALIRAVHAVGSALELARRTVRGKIASLMLATLVIWSLEAAALWALSSAVVGSADTPGLLAVLSDAFLPLASPALASQLATHRSMVLVVLFGLSVGAATALSLPEGAPARARAQ